MIHMEAFVDEMNCNKIEVLIFGFLDNVYQSIFVLNSNLFVMQNKSNMMWPIAQFHWTK